MGEVAGGTATRPSIGVARRVRRDAARVATAGRLLALKCRVELLEEQLDAALAVLDPGNVSHEEEVLARLLLVAPVLHALLLGQVPLPVDTMRRNLSLHHVAVTAGDIATSSPTRMNALQRQGRAQQGLFDVALPANAKPLQVAELEMQLAARMSANRRLAETCRAVLQTVQDDALEPSACAQPPPEVCVSPSFPATPSPASLCASPRPDATVEEEAGAKCAVAHIVSDESVEDDTRVSVSQVVPTAAAVQWAEVASRVPPPPVPCLVPAFVKKAARPGRAVSFPRTARSSARSGAERRTRSVPCGLGGWDVVPGQWKPTPLPATTLVVKNRYGPLAPVEGVAAVPDSVACAAAAAPLPSPKKTKKHKKKSKSDVQDDDAALLAAMQVAQAETASMQQAAQAMVPGLQEEVRRTQLTCADDHPLVCKPVLEAGLECSRCHHDLLGEAAAGCRRCYLFLLCKRCVSGYRGCPATS